MKIFYWHGGNKYGFRARNLNDALNRKYALRKQYGHEGAMSGCGHFHYFDKDGNRHWI